MKSVTLLVFTALIFGTSGYLIKVPTAPVQPRVVQSGWIHLQKLLLPLFENVCEDSTNPVIIRLAQEFSLNNSSGFYLNPQVITNFQKYQVKGFLPKGEIFTNYDFEHITQLITLYSVLFNAKDFDTFYKVASWSRQNVNCGLFINAVYTAVLNRRDTENLSVPAPYEVIPNYFIQKDVIIQASGLLSDEKIFFTDSVRDEGNSYVLDANYTANFLDNDSETKLSYFHEDIGLNSYYFLQNLKRFSWFNTSVEKNINYGEYLYHMVKQLTARYNLERYTNGMPEVEDINLAKFTADPYNPMLIYSNGKEFGHRSMMSSLSDADNAQLLQTIESNIATVVTHMRDTGYNKSEILNHLMGILVTGEKSFETLLRTLIGKDTTFTNSQPSVLDHYMTSLRDPVWWRINKKIVDLVDESLKVLPAYTKNDLYFPGIELQNIDVKKMMTNFDYFQFDVTDALKTDTINPAFQVKIGQTRLNHKPFVVKLNISSLVTQKGLVKIYLGPKVAPGEFTLNKNKFMLLDSFECNFKMGTNVISRSSDEMKNFSDDFTSLRNLRKKIEDAEFGLNILPFKKVDSLLGFPSRLILPKGTPEGIPLQLLAFIAPYVQSNSGVMFSVPGVEFNSAVLSPGYPLDLDIQDSQFFDLPNAMVKDIIITHKGDKTSNYGETEMTNKWQKTTYDAALRPDFSAKRKEPFNFSSKTGQYENKEEFATKRKEPFDYNLKKGKYDRKDDFTIKKFNDSKNDKIEDADPNHQPDSKLYLEEFNKTNDSKIVPQEIIENNSVEEIKQNEESHEYLNPEYKSYLYLPRSQSVYDYIVHNDYYDDNIYDPESKVYE